MNDQWCLELYVKTLKSFRSKIETDALDNPEGIVKDVRRVLEAADRAKAGEAIEWWNCWDEKHTAERFARRMRRLATK